MKSHRGAAKRFRLTKNGKVKRERAFLNHLRTSKTRKQKRRLRQQTLVSKGDLRRTKRMIAC
ncbi:MAG: 50S ribosomal protein L35 [bacterium]